MGLEFGRLPVRFRRIAYYGLSPLEQRTWAKSITHRMPNWLNRMRLALPPLIPGFLMTAVVLIGAPLLHERYTRKNPKLYENDK